MILSNFKKELLITKRLLEDNIPGLLVTFTVPTICRYLIFPTSIGDLIQAVVSCLFLCFIKCYMFECGNQSFSGAEDELNKPFRPIPSGLLSEKSLRFRLLLIFLIGTFIVSNLHGSETLPWILSWQFLIITCYVWPKINHWFLKCFSVGLGTLTNMRIANVVLKNINEKWDLPLACDLITFVWITVVINVQDFSETKGDRAIGRKTLPLILSEQGMKRLRRFLATFVILISLVFFIFGCYLFSHFRLVIILLVSFYHIVVAVILATRVINGGNEEMDKVTFFRYYWYTLTLIYIQMTYFGLYYRFININA